MIYATLHDAGTQLRTQAATVPGCDLAWWTDSRLFETSIFEIRERVAAQNAFMADLAGRKVRPWPLELPAHAWVDWTPRYEYSGTDGLALDLHHLDYYSPYRPIRPLGEVRFRTNNVYPILHPADAQLARELTVRETAESQAVPSDWYRLPTLNESGGTQLREPVALRVQAPRAPVLLTMPDNSLWTPFDLTAGPDRYRAVTVGEGGQVVDIPEDEVAAALALHPRGRYRLHLRPRRWRYYVIVYAVYYYISFFDFFPVAQAVSLAWYDQPPKYPTRHNVLSGNDSDPGINWQFEHSNAAAELRTELYAHQWHTLSEAFVFGYIDHTEMWAYRYWPFAGEYVLGVERLDEVTGRRSAVWAVTRSDESSRYPQSLIYYDPTVPFYVAPFEPW